MSTVSHSQSDRPERSRNAKAQARHRAKRKAYIEQLEQTVTKLQTTMGYTHEDISALPPPLIKIRELEQENSRLLKENEEMRRMLADRGIPLDVRRGSFGNYLDTRNNCDRDYKRRKMEDIYMNTDGSHEIMTRPPPLTIPQPSSHHYSNLSSTASSNGSLFTLHAGGGFNPNTPSASSATSSPPFSPAQMQQPSVSPVGHRPLSSHQVLPNYSPHYGHVKVEDDGYGSQSQSASNANQINHYSLPSFNHGQPDDMNGWHGYSSERAAAQR